MKQRFTSFLFYTDVYFPIYYLGDGNANKSKANKIKGSITFYEEFDVFSGLTFTRYSSFLSKLLKTSA